MWKGILLVLLGACSFGILSSIVKLGYQQGFTLGELCSLQAGYGMVALWLIHWISGAATYGLKSKDARTCFILGSSTGLVSITYYQSVQYIPASIGIILLMQFTWMSMLAEWMIYKKKPTPTQWVAVALILAGTCLAGGLISNGASEINLAGIGYGLLAAFFYTIFIVVSGRVGRSLTPVLKSAWIVTGAFVVITLIFPPVYLINGRFTETSLWIWGLPLALFGTVLPPFLFSKGMPQTGVSLGAILSAAELPVATIAAMVLLHEKITIVQVVGVFVILGAIVLANLRKKLS
ncbi:Threonine/homoserine efflux transporter RhtA [Chitinophaga jiangningensis]|uniref:Threonine/homoserine efflux transporter RhtA n=1 Tax=Chitinophaga jiangningensis TaxID=1419482 RepID=A0A1M7HG18_9BACT|nr:DMT family transporter [Chitinophaga jiangningensis]SHM27435.1 Threonine/homoserine efflux transporter RhtA [Chitinophaga jiangningensis]